jgi:hypothetical protein
MKLQTPHLKDQFYTTTSEFCNIYKYFMYNICVLSWSKFYIVFIDFSNSRKTDRNMSEVRQVACKNKFNISVFVGFIV